MNGLATQTKPGTAMLLPDVEKAFLNHIQWNQEMVGTISWRNLKELNRSILDDVYEDEWDVIYPVFDKLKKQNAIYLDEIRIKEEFQGKGIGQQVIGDLLNENRPVLLYSLADAEEFWEKMKFEHICGYYYAWQPEEVL